MTRTIETVKLTETVGAEVRGIDVDRLLHDEDLPAWTHHALEANGVLVFRDLHIDDAALPYDPQSPREMHRTTLHGDEAIQS
jgi:alpha-ketoglutarate-dependent taurine dioxygenase